MKKITIDATITIYDQINEMPNEVQKLMLKAIEIRKKAYAPYSKFRVGAAIKLSNGEIVLGSNQENAAYPSGLCAERVAIYHAGALFPEAKILQIAISATSDDYVLTTPVPPCGSCRQSISEYEVKQESPIEIYFMGGEGEIFKSDSIANLLPFSFGKNFL